MSKSLDGVPLGLIKREYKKNLKAEHADALAKQRRLLDRELRRAGKVRTNFRKGQLKKLRSGQT